MRWKSTGALLVRAVLLLLAASVLGLSYCSKQEERAGKGPSTPPAAPEGQTPAGKLTEGAPLEARADFSNVGRDPKQPAPAPEKEDRAPVDAPREGDAHKPPPAKDPGAGAPETVTAGREGEPAAEEKKREEALSKAPATTKAEFKGKKRAPEKRWALKSKVSSSTIVGALDSRSLTVDGMGTGSIQGSTGMGLGGAGIGTGRLGACCE